MQPQYITAFEHQSLTVGDPGSSTDLTTSEAEQLAFLGELRPGFCERSYRTVRLAQYCGLVTLGHRVLEILPKIDDGSPPDECRGLLLRMLSEAERVSLFRHVAVGQHLKHSSLLEVFIAAFFDAVTNIVRGGLLRQYRECEEDLQVVRGRILADRQFSVHANRPDALACRFDDLTGDNLWNRLLKAGMRAVRPWISSGELSRRWVELMAAFDEIEDERPSAMALNRLVFDRQAARYRSAIDWVRWILALLSPDLRAGRNAAPGLLFDMNVLFESAVSTAMQRRAPDVGFQVSSQDTGRHLATVVESAGKRAFGIRPDLVIRQGEEVIAVGDTKWKRVGMSKTGYLLPAEADMYQMHAYAATFGCEKLALVYPWYSELAESKETAFELPAFGTKHPVVHVVCIDLHTVPFTLVRGGNIPGFASLFKSC